MGAAAGQVLGSGMAHSEWLWRPHSTSLQVLNRTLFEAITKQYSVALVTLTAFLQMLVTRARIAGCY